MGRLSPTLGRCRRDEAVKFLAALSWLLLFSWGLSGVESLCWAGHANKLHHFCLGDRGQWHAICQRQGMNEPHLHCASALSLPRLRWQRGRWQRRRDPPPPELCWGWRAPGRARGPGEPPHLTVSVGLTIQRRNREKSPPSAPPAPKGRRKETRGVHSSCKDTKTQWVSCPRIRSGLPAHARGHKGLPHPRPQRRHPAPSEAPLISDL